MRKKRLKGHDHYRALILKGLCLLLAGVVVNLAFLLSTDTLSWFTSARSACLQVNAAITTDLIEKISVEKTNPREIKIKKAVDYTGTPVLYFAIEGEALEYLAHLNPVRLDSHEEISVPLTPRVQLHQFFKLLTKGNDVTGTLRVKYLNEFIDEEFSLTYTNQFLLNCFLESLKERLKDKPGGTRGMSLLKGENREEFRSLLRYIIEETGWETVSEILEEKRPLETRLEEPPIDCGGEGNSPEPEEDSYIGEEKGVNQEELPDISDGDIRGSDEDSSTEPDEVSRENDLDTSEDIPEVSEDVTEASEGDDSGLNLNSDLSGENDDLPSKDNSNNKNDSDESLEDSSHDVSVSSDHLE